MATQKTRPLAYKRSNIVDVIEGRRDAPILKATLSALSYFYQAGIALRHLAYNARLLKTKKVPAYVISVGNIVAGGTGKTPFIRLLAEECFSFAKIGILSRGYLSAVERSGRCAKVAPEGDAKTVGDEPLLLARALPKASVWVGKSRFHSAKKALDDGCNLLLLDDGLQHRKLYRNKDIIILDGGDLWGGNRFLPRGLLRDFPGRLKTADLVVLHPYEEQAAIEIRKRTHAPIIGVEWKFKISIPSCVALFCGIGNPGRFISMVSECANIISLLRLPDHVSPDLEELFYFAKDAKERGAEAIVCTEKDAVKLPGDLVLDLPIIPIPAVLSVVKGKLEWEKFICEIKKKYE